jgi:hypothetical protein
LEEELFRVRGAEDNSSRRVEAHVGFTVVINVFWRCVHPRAEEDSSWVFRRASVGG